MTTKTNKTKEISIISTLSVNNDNQITVSSLDIADRFDKDHAKVIRAVETMDCSSKFSKANFGVTSKTTKMPNGGTRQDKSYQMTKDGFIFLVMGFNGKKAAKFKEEYINAFNEMLQQISSQPQISSNVRHIDIMEQGLTQQQLKVA